MALGLHNQVSAKNTKAKKRVGRGNASGKGTTAGRGSKGQKARSGGRSGLKLKGMKANLQNIPKLPGFKSLRSKKEVVNISALETHFNNGDLVNASTLEAKKLIVSKKVGVKILGNGTLSKKLKVAVDAVSQSAADAITKAGGTVIVPKKKIEADQSNDSK